MQTVTPLIAVFTLCLCSCSRQVAQPTAESLSKMPSANATAEAGKFLRDLRDQGKLPGLAQGEHGELKAAVPEFSAGVRFPFSQTFVFTKDSDTVYHYTVEKLTTNSEWRLMRAWQTDATGKTGKEFPSP